MKITNWARWSLLILSLGTQACYEEHVSSPQEQNQASSSKIADVDLGVSKNYELNNAVEVLSTKKIEELANTLYPDLEHPDEKKIVTNFFSIMVKHKSQDPFKGGRGPSVEQFNYNKLRFGWMINETATTVDLAFFNSQDLFESKKDSSLTKENSLSKLFGSPVYVYKNILKRTIATFGDSGDQLGNISFLQGSGMTELYYKNIGVTISEEELEQADQVSVGNDYLKRTHPLRLLVKDFVIPLYSPKLDSLLASAKEVGQPIDFSLFSLIASFVQIHESYHLFDKENEAHGKSKQFLSTIDGDKIKTTLKNNAAAAQKTQNLLKTYYAVIYELGYELGENPKLNSPSQKEKILLSDLAATINSIKKQNDNLWKFIWQYEYIEGFAEYVAAQSLVAAGIQSMKARINAEITDNENNMTYRTGAIGGLFLNQRVKNNPFTKADIKLELSVWEIIIRENKIQASKKIEDVFNKYAQTGHLRHPVRKFEEEVSLILDAPSF